MPVVLEALHWIPKKLLPQASRSVLFHTFMHRTHIIIDECYIYFSYDRSTTLYLH